MEYSNAAMGAMERGLAAAGGEQGERVAELSDPFRTLVPGSSGLGLECYRFVNRLMLEPGAGAAVLVLPLLLVL